MYDNYIKFNSNSKFPYHKFSNFYKSEIVINYNMEIPEEIDLICPYFNTWLEEFETIKYSSSEHF